MNHFRSLVDVTPGFEKCLARSKVRAGGSEGGGGVGGGGSEGGVGGEGRGWGE